MSTNADSDFNKLVSARAEPAPPSLVSALASVGKPVRAPAGLLLVASGTASDEVYIILGGSLRITIFSADGREVIIRDLGPGRFFGDLAAVDGGRRSTSVVAIEDSRLLVVPAAEFRRQVAQTPDNALWFAAHLISQVRALTERVLELSTLNVSSRLHCQLLRLCAVAGVADNRAVLEPPPTHEVLATMIGTHREAVTRELAYLASVGIVEHSRRRLEVKDVERLSGLVRSATGEQRD